MTDTFAPVYDELHQCVKFDLNGNLYIIDSVPWSKNYWTAVTWCMDRFGVFSWPNPRWFHSTVNSLIDNDYYVRHPRALYFLNSEDHLLFVLANK